MNRDFNPRQIFHNSVALGALEFSPSNFKTFNRGWGLRSLLRRGFSINKSIGLPNFIEQPSEELPEILQQVYSFEPLRTCTEQRQLARQALTALKHRQNENFRNLANRIANDVAGAVD